MIQLRPYQHHAIENLRRSIANGHKRVLLQAATGAGKTVIASEMIRLAMLKGKRALFIAHRKEIINQTSHKLDAFGIPHGVIMAKHTLKNTHPVQVASIQTLIRRDKPEADLIIIDECHLSCSTSYQQLLEEYPKAVFIGLTATPVRLDGRGLGEIYHDIVEVIPMATLIAEGHLVKPRVFAPFTPDMKNVRTVKGDYDATQAAEIMNHKQITGDIIKHWQKAAVGRKTIVFASSVLHSKNIVTEFIKAGISAKHLDANTPAIERDKTLQAWRDGEFMVLSNMGLFVEGLDVPAASCCILARPTKSVTIYLQAVGRIMRPHESKSDCIILDHAGLTYEHGFLDMPRVWILDGKKKRNNAIAKDNAVNVCESCFCAYSKAEHPDKCPECGLVTPKPPPPKVRSDGELIELTTYTMEQYNARRKQIMADELRAAKTLEQLIDLGKKRGYKAGWAHIKWAERKSWLEKHGYPVPEEKPSNK